MPELVLVEDKPGLGSLCGRDLLRIDDLVVDELLALLDLADRLKALQHERIPHPLLPGRSLAMIFEKPSTRTRVSFEVGMVQLGGHAVHLATAESQLGRGEPIADTGAVLSRYVDAIMIRTHSHSRVEELAQAASVPVVNGLTDEHHPCQALADLMVLRERLGDLEGRRLAWVGDGLNNVCHSLLTAAAMVGMEVVVASPDGYAPDPDVVDAAASRGGGRRRPGRGGRGCPRRRHRHVDEHGPGGRPRPAAARPGGLPGERPPAHGRRARSRRPALPARALRRGDHARTSCGGRTRPHGTRPKTGCTPRRRCWP